MEDEIDLARQKEETQNLVGKGTLCSNIGALIIKRLHMYKRDITGYLCEFIVPLILVGVGITIAMTTDLV